ncbi:highly divergent homeobox isoform X1 [Megalops cyprinoides]|uniref:highly divergent homeobox isoform X1 n=1 Tax=Megalops cyprinoides TaxID=118141 RepID=UPI0018655280|nr:highly divergent homeobox isoform X1 [Megalops cyprinoides]XP_036404146.1 highly divergent homeobox isoform X1 [Megalops cyprinoides]XP_036404147.1 highly divergent homeobox isoform X1 [Megalops cyprinoides]
MEAWQEKRSMQNMNLRSVFTAEQQQILERYYENGMTNQSKSCFQLILQCAQETKLDFSVVRTWVGNKRRKLASKMDQNGSVAQGPPSHSLVGSGPGALVAGVVLTPEMAAARNVQRGATVTHLLPPVSSSSSSSSSSCSPHSSGSGHSNNNNNNDVIVTGIYSLSRASSRPESSTHARTAAKAPPPPRTEAELPIQIHVGPALHTDSPPLHTKAVSLPRKAPQHSPASGPALYSQVRKPYSPGDSAGMPRSWARQYGLPQSQPWPFPSQSQSQPAPAGTAAHSSPQVGDPGVRIQQVFTLAALGDGQYRPQSGSSHPRGQIKTRPPDTTGCFSIAMETGDADDEYAREEELANMGAQVQMSQSSSGGGDTGGGTGTGSLPRRDSPGVPAMARNPAAVNPPNSEPFGGKGYQAPSSSPHCPPRLSSFYSGTTSRSSSGSSSSYPVRVPFQGSGQMMPSLQQASSTLCAPWITSNSRKRTLQDRTQFSDKDLHTLKRYWDNGMTSLGSVCREKISAASTELSVDSEIVKTWIGNRRRKYRLMGIEIPPPKGGPAVFTNQSETESPRCLTPEVDEVKTPEPGEDSERNDEVSICLSEDGTSDTYQREEGGDGDGETNSTTLADNVKIEIIDDEEEEEDDGDVSGSDMEQLQNLLEFKHEEVRYLESELENQKQKYSELQSFTRNLLNAVKNDDKEKQQELLASLPQEAEDWEMSPEREEEPGASAITIQSCSSVPEEMGDQLPP